MPAIRTQVDHPHVGWWVAVLGGMGMLAVLAFHAGTYAVWCEHVTTVFPQRLLRSIFVLALLAHFAEAAYAFRVARRAGLGANAGGWFLQTMTLGYPSLRLLRRRVRGV